MKRRRHPQWNWATSLDITLTDDGTQTPGTPLSLAVELLPAARVQYLCGVRNRDHITVAGILLWLDFTWSLEGANGAGELVAVEASPQSVDFWIMRSQSDANVAATDTPVLYAPFHEPVVPSAITTWNSATDDEPFDGTDPFLWVHHQTGYAPNEVSFQTSGDSNSTYGNTAFYLQSALGMEAILNPIQAVRQAWAPDVFVKTRRRLDKTNNLLIGLNTQATTIYGIPSGGTGALGYGLGVHARVLIA